MTDGGYPDNVKAVHLPPTYVSTFTQLTETKGSRHIMTYRVQYII